MAIDGTPFSTDSELFKIISKTGAAHNFRDQKTLLDSVKWALAIAHDYYPTLTDWEKAAPLKLAELIKDGAKLPDLYVTAGFNDEFLSYEGSQKFSEILKQKGSRIEWRPQWGHHCVVDIQSLAKFLTN